MWDKLSKNSSSSSVSQEGPEWQLLEKVATASLVEQRRARRWSIFFKCLTFAYIAFFLFALKPMGGKNIKMPNQEHVGLVSIRGVIADDSHANANTIVTGLRKAFEAEKSRAVLLDINSPGGSPVQSGYVYDEIMRLKAQYPDKKVYTVISDLGASGAYYIAAAADEIYANRASLVGSIGVISAGFGFTGTMEKLGVERRLYTSGEHKSFLDPFSEQNAEETAFWQNVLDVTHRQFKDAVRQGRGERLQESEDTFSGLVWSGEQALQKGLIDGLGSAGYVSREVVGIDHIVDYTVVPNPFEELAKQLGANVGNGLMSAIMPRVQ